MGGDTGRSAIPIETDRLILRELATEDASFILALVNDPDWLRFIGDRRIRTLVDAGAYILGGPVAMYRRLGFGLWHVALKDGTAIGICGLIKRDTLDHVDLGFAFLPAYRGRGYAFEAAAASLAYGRNVLKLERIVATTALDNEASGRLLEKLGLRFERVIRPAADGAELKLYGRELSAARCGS
ncbi:MAG: Ribosomal-protein-alanine acetyltransferase [Rhodospirillales bacterium]|nr:Ribosomal-protein-alanine acetyltransferase [Rhodospirillales bacterium]